MKECLLRFGSYRDYFLFYFGINSGLRISDIVDLQVYHLREKQHIIIHEKKKKGKKGNRRTITVNEKMREEIDRYIKGMDDEDYLFPSRKGGKPITTTQAYRILRKAADYAGIKNVGTHTMRKTFGYHYYKRTNDLVSLVKIFNHADPSSTLHYIGIEQEQLDESLKDFNL